MDILYWVGFVFGGFLYSYPISKLFKWIFNKTSWPYSASVSISYVLTFIVLYLLYTNLGVNDVRVFISQLVGIGILSFIDFQRHKKNVIFFSILHNIATRIIVAFVFFIISFVNMPLILQAIFRSDWYGWSLIGIIISIGYVVLIVWKRKPIEINK